MSNQDGRAGSEASPAKNPLLVYVYKSQRVVGTRKNTYQEAVKACRDLFPSIPQFSQLSLHTQDLDVCDGHLTELSTESWQYALPQLKSVTAMLKTAQGVPQAANVLRVFFRSYTGRTLEVRTHENRDIASVVLRVQENMLPETCLDDIRLIYAGRQLPVDSGTVADWKLSNEATIHVVAPLRGGKPVIYLFAPDRIEATVSLSLAPQWELSAIYPVVPIKNQTQQQNQQVSWRVDVHPNGELTELTSGLDVSYLFWEAHTLPKLLDSPPPSPTLQANSATTIESFIPNDPVLTDDNAVLLPVDALTPYIDAALKILGLHTEARTSFITYWLPSFLKHKHVALRFLPQAAYEKAAPLDVSPTPDVVTRIFMLFRGVKDEDLVAWSSAQAKAEEDVAFWVEKVGADVSRTLDSQLFRVVEWGGMEVVV